MAGGKRGRRKTRFDGKDVCVWLTTETIERLDRLAEATQKTRAELIGAGLELLEAPQEAREEQARAAAKLALVKVVFETKTPPELSAAKLALLRKALDD